MDFVFYASSATTEAASEQTERQMAELSGNEKLFMLKIPKRIINRVCMLHLTVDLRVCYLARCSFVRGFTELKKGFKILKRCLFSVFSFLFIETDPVLSRI